ncbi:MAG: DUF3024 domain-containing protein [Isosphaeraceae bacterium]
MKSKHPPGQPARRRAVTVADRRQSGGRAVILDFVQSRIEAFNDEHGGGVSVRKDAHGYTLVRDDEGIPIARLRPKGQGLFEILYWNPFHARWRSVGSFGTVLALDQALDFIADDPMDCFWR